MCQVYGVFCSSFEENKCLNSLNSTLPPCVWGPRRAGLLSEYVNHRTTRAKPTQRVESLLRFLLPAALMRPLEPEMCFSTQPGVSTCLRRSRTWPSPSRCWTSELRGTCSTWRRWRSSSVAWRPSSGWWKRITSRTSPSNTRYWAGADLPFRPCPCHTHTHRLTRCVFRWSHWGRCVCLAHVTYPKNPSCMQVKEVENKSFIECK